MTERDRRVLVEERPVSTESGPWRWYWLLWIVLGFGIPETIALVKKREKNTFSRAAQAWLDTWRRKRLRKSRAVTFAAFWLGLGGHLLMGWPAWPTLIIPAVPLAAFIVLSLFVWRER